MNEFVLKNTLDLVFDSFTRDRCDVIGIKMNFLIDVNVVPVAQLVLL
jgi:hypothetical protein